jgi:hypothetical protein
MPFITRGKNIKKEAISSHLRFSIGMASSDVGSTAAAAAVAAASKVLVLSTATHLKGFLHTKPPFLFTVTTPEETEERKSESLRREQIGNDDAAVTLTSKVRDDDDDEALLTNNTEDAAAATRALPETRAATESMTKYTYEKRPKNKGGGKKKKRKNQNKRTSATRLAKCGHKQQTGKEKINTGVETRLMNFACVGGLVGVCASASDRDGVGEDDDGRAGLGRGSPALISIKWRLS